MTQAYARLTDAAGAGSSTDKTLCQLPNTYVRQSPFYASSEASLCAGHECTSLPPHQQAPAFGRRLIRTPEGRQFWSGLVRGARSTLDPGQVQAKSVPESGVSVEGHFSSRFSHVPCSPDTFHPNDFSQQGWGCVVRTFLFFYFIKVAKYFTYSFTCFCHTSCPPTTTILQLSKNT